MRAAQFLATHALLLFGLGILAIAAALVAVVFAVRAGSQYYGRLRSALTALVQYAGEVASFGRLVSRFIPIVPGGYLVLLLVPGLALTAAATVFVVLARRAGGRNSRRRRRPAPQTANRAGHRLDRRAGWRKTPQSDPESDIRAHAAGIRGPDPGGVRLELSQRTCDGDVIFCGLGVYLLLRGGRSAAATVPIVTAVLLCVW